MIKKFYKSNHYKLIRLGSTYDGGYLVCPNAVSSSDHLVSLGIDTNWEFENDFLKKGHLKSVFCYDGQTSYPQILRFFIIQLFKLIGLRPDLNLLVRSIKNLVTYFIVLNRKLGFIKKNVGLNDGISLKEILAFKKKIFLKVDIEGSEYRILNDLLEYKKDLTGLVIEFHDYDLFENEIQEFIEKIGMQIVHVHINELGGFNMQYKPLAIEISFSSCPKKGENKFFKKMQKPNGQRNSLVSLDNVKI